MNIYGRLGLTFGLCGLASSIYLGIKLYKISNTVNSTIDELAGKTNLDISDSIINAAVQKATDREVQSLIRLTKLRLDEEIRRRVKNSIDSCYSELEDSVSNEIANRVKNINIQSIEREAIDKAKKAIAEKFDGKLDGLLDGFNDNLNTVSKIYSSIAKSMSEKS